MHRFLTSWLCVAWIVSAGCGQAKPAPVVADSATEIKSEPKTDVTSITTTSSASVPLVVTATEGTAEATFQKTLIAFQEGRFDTAYDFLPPSYRADVNSLVGEFAEKMDAELWSKFFEILTKVANVLKTKKSLILGLESVKRTPQIDLIKPHWDSIVSGIHDGTESEVANLSARKQADVRKLLASGSLLLKGLPFPKFGDVKVTTLKSDGDEALLSYRDSNETEPKQVEFVRVDGKWLPKSIATGWATGVADLKAAIGVLPERISAVKPQVMAHFDSIRGILDKMHGATTAEEFNVAMAPLPIAVFLGAQVVQQAIRDATTSSRKEKAVLCVIHRELNDAEQTELKDAVLAALNDSGADYEMIPNDGKTRCRFTPVPDAEALVVVLQKHFNGATVRFDAETRTIHID